MGDELDEIRGIGSRDVGNRGTGNRGTVRQLADQGAADAVRGDSLALFEKRLVGSHWESDVGRRAYARAFLATYHRLKTGHGIDPDELDLQVYAYDERVRAHDEQTREERAARGREAKRSALIREVNRELAQQRAQRLPGVVDVRKYPVLSFHAAVGGTLGPMVEVIIKFVPYVGEAVMLLEGILGRELYTEREIGTGERVFNILLAAVPMAGQILRAGRSAPKAIAAVAADAGLSAEQVVALLQSMDRLDPRAIRVAQKALSGAALSKVERDLVDSALRTLEDSGVARSVSGEAGAGGAALKRKHKPTIGSDPTLFAGEGATDKFGNISVSPYGTAVEKALVLAHEKVHSWLSPKWLNGLRTFRADLRMTAYRKLGLCRYLEEALAETVAQVKVNGLSVGKVLEGIRFPIANGYVTLSRVVTEAAIGTIVYGGVIYGVYLLVDGQ